MGAAPDFVPQPKAASSPSGLGAVHRYFETSLYLLLVTGVLTVISTGKLDPVTSATAIIALLLKGRRWWRGVPPELSESAAKRLTIGYMFFVPVDLFFVSMALARDSQNQPLFAALLTVIHLLVFVMIVRLYSARNTRDYLFLAMVAFALVLVSAILTIDTAFVVFLVIFLLLCVSTFMGLELRRSAEGAAAPPLASGTSAAKRLNGALSLTAAGLSIGTVLLGAGIFLLLPRITAGFLSGYNFQPTIMSGFADGDVQLGQIGQIKQSSAVVMRVKPLRGTLGAEYWRGDALTNFDGSRWTTPPNTPRSAEARDVSLSPTYYIWSQWDDLAQLSVERKQQIGDLYRAHKAWPQPFSYRVFLEPIGSDMVFLATQGSAVSGTFAPGADRVGQRRRGNLYVDFTHSVSNPAHNYTRMVYDGQSWHFPYLPELLRQAGTEVPPEIRERYLQLPDLEPAIKQLAERVTAKATTQYDKVAAIQSYLSTNYIYSLELTGESLGSFLFKRKAGHCEYFATAMAVLLRTIGIPTRYARGFHGGEYNDVGEDWILRARDAHSWVEVYFPDLGWITFDPTPPSPTGLRGFLHRLALYWDWAELIWVDWVVNYNAQQQGVLSQNVQRQSIRWSSRLYQWARGNYDDTVDLMGRFRRGLILYARNAPGSLAALMLSISAAMLYLWKARAIREWLAVRFGVRLGREEETRLVTLYYQQMLNLLARRGFQKAPGQTPSEFAASVRASPNASPFAKLVATATTVFEEARYGSSAADLPQFAALLDTLRNSGRSE